MGVLSVCVLTLGAGSAFAHDGRPPEPHDLWSAWTFDAGMTMPLVLAAVLYLRGLRTLTRTAAAHGRGARRRRAVGFAVGWLVLAVALLSPVHALAEALFSMHMVQHELLMVVAAPVLVLSRPVVSMLWSLPAPWRRRIGRTLHARLVRRGWTIVSTIPAAWAIHAVAIWMWHLPVLYDRTLTSSVAHAAQHVSFFATAVLFWWSITRNKTARASGVLALFTTAVHTGALGALIALSPAPWYPRYGETSGAWRLTALEDQQLGGLIMWVGSGLYFLLATAVVFFAWASREEAADRRPVGVL